jgi:Domain of unknown function (DUF6881)
VPRAGTPEPMTVVQDDDPRVRFMVAPKRKTTPAILAGLAHDPEARGDPVMRYQRVIWHHDHEDEPVVLYAEIDDDGYERRKVDEYRDGRLDFADELHETGSTGLGVTPIPPLELINADLEFTADAIDAAVFEAVWRRASSTPDG